MPAKNIYHEAVVRALIADGWTITDDPLTLSFGGRDLYVDLGADRPTIGAEKDEQRIAVEIQSFLNPSPVRLSRRRLAIWHIPSYPRGKRFGSFAVPRCPSSRLRGIVD